MHSDRRRTANQRKHNSLLSRDFVLLQEKTMTTHQVTRCENITDAKIISIIIQKKTEYSEDHLHFHKNFLKNPLGPYPSVSLNRISMNLSST